MRCCPHCAEYGDENELKNHPQGYGNFCATCGYQDEEASQPLLEHDFTARRRDAEGEFISNEHAVDHRIRNYLSSPMGFDLKAITNFLLVDPATRLFPFAAHKISREACRIHLELVAAHQKRKTEPIGQRNKWNEKYTAAAAIKIACGRHNEAIVASLRQGEKAESTLYTKESEAIIPPSVKTIATRLAHLYPPLEPTSDSYGEIKPARLARVVSRTMAVLGYAANPLTDIMARIQPIMLHLDELQAAMHSGDDEIVFATLVFTPTKDQKGHRQKWRTGSKTHTYLKDINLANVRSHIDSIFLISSVIGLWEGCFSEAVGAAIVLTALEAEARWKADPVLVLEQELGAISDAQGYTIMEHYYKLREIGGRWAHLLPRIGVAVPPLPQKKRKHVAQGAWGGPGYLGDIRRTASLRDTAAAWWGTICANAQQLIHYRIKTLSADIATPSRSRGTSWAPPTTRSPSFGPQFPPSPAMTVQSLLEHDDLERAIQKGEDSSDYESLYDSDAESHVSPRRERRLPLTHGALADAGPVHIAVDYPIAPLRERAVSESSEGTSRSYASSDVTTQSYASTSGWTPLRSVEELGEPIHVDREPYDPVLDHGLLIGERTYTARLRPSALRRKGLLVSEEVKKVMLSCLNEARASGEIPRRLAARETDIMAYLDRAAIDGVHPLRALLVAGYEPDEIPHFHLVHSILAFRCAWEGLDALHHPFTDSELLGDEFDSNVRTREERRLYDAELHVDGIWDEWIQAEARREANAEKIRVRREAVEERERRLREKGKSRRLNEEALLEPEEDADEMLALEYSWKDTDLGIPDLNMDLVAKVAKNRGFPAAKPTKKKNKRSETTAGDEKPLMKRARA